jgi:hypothetical protein
MRYALRFLLVCALGVLPAVGCGENEEVHDLCEGVFCEDDGNQCTYDTCNVDTGECEYIWVEDTDRGTSCDDGDDNRCTAAECRRGSCESLHVSTNNGSVCTFDGLRGVCVDGVCGEDLCKGVVCVDYNLDDCGEPYCNVRNGTCDVSRVVPDGTACSTGFWSGSCSDGVCRTLF